MDMSKLPRLSQTPAPTDNTAADVQPGAAPGASPAGPGIPPAAAPQLSASPALAPAPRDLAGAVAEAWISIAVGLLLLFFIPTTLQYAASKLLHTPFAPFPDPNRDYPARCDFIQYTDGTKLFYRELPNFWSDLVITAFALVLLLDGLVLLLARRRATLLAALICTSVATVGNLLWLVGSYSRYGLAMMSVMAVLFGTYIALHQWSLLASIRPVRRETSHAPA